MASDAAGSHQLTIDQLLQVAQDAESAGDLDRALGCMRGLAARQPNKARWAFEAVRLLRESDRHDEAAAAMNAAMRRWPRAVSRPEIAALVPAREPAPGEVEKALGEDCPPDAALRRPLVEDDGSRDVITVEGGRKAAVILFTGLADRMTLPLPVFDRYMAELDLTAIYLRDRRRLGYFGGVESLGKDYDETLMRLKELLVDLGARTVHTVGSSAGGIGAVSYGLDLRARTVLGFSAPTALTEATRAVDRRAPVFNQRLLKQVPPERRDLRGRALAAKSSTRIHLYYGADMPEDRYHAAAMEGVPSVTLHPVDGLAGHGAVFRIAGRQGLRSVFREMFGEND